MSHTITLVVNVSLSLLGLGFLVWLSVRTLKRSGDPMKLVFKWAVTIPFVAVCLFYGARIGPFGPFLIVFMAVVLSFMWTPHISEMLFSPLTNLFDGGSEPPEGQNPSFRSANGK